MCILGLGSSSARLQPVPLISTVARSMTAYRSVPHFIRSKLAFNFVVNQRKDVRRKLRVLCNTLEFDNGICVHAQLSLVVGVHFQQFLGEIQVFTLYRR